MRGLAGKRILVAGSGSGIGAATARRLAQEGARLVLGDLNEEGARRVAAEIVEGGGEAEAARFDLADPESIRSLVDGAARTLGGLDGIANVAADLAPENVAKDGPIAEMDLATWERTLRANLLGYALIIQAAIPHLTAAGGGAVVNTTSMAAWIGEPARVAYAASKAGVNSLTRHVATTYGDRDIRCNAVAPGLILSETVLANAPDDLKETARAQMTLSRFGEPDDVAAALCFLLSDDAEWVTGQVWSVNGGGGYRE